MDCPIRAESGKGRSAHIFNLNERAVSRRARGRGPEREAGLAKRAEMRNFAGKIDDKWNRLNMRNMHSPNAPACP